MKGIIYYTDNMVDDQIAKWARKSISNAYLAVVSTSLEPIDFGLNIVVEGDRGYVAMISQIITALENLWTDYVFFCEHDVLYPKSHFDFKPLRDDIYYYNKNVWRWAFGSDHAIRYDRMICLSGMCCHRELALAHYRLKWDAIQSAGESQFESRDPGLARVWGHEPGTKKKKRGGLTDEDFDTWSSEEPLIDIRHRNTFSPTKTRICDFKHAPVGWEEISIDNISEWNLKQLFNL